MSKKSRKRNKRILAVLGVGAAAAVAAKKKRDAVISDGDKNDNANKTIVKKDTGPVKTKTTIQDNKPKKAAVVAKKPIPGITARNDGSIKSSKFDKKSPNTVYKNKTDYVNRTSTVPETKKKSIGESLSYNSTFAKNQRKNAPVTGTTLPGMKSGGRAGYKSGGSIKKSMGKALRGGGKVMR